MRTAAELHAAAERAGLRITSIEQVPTAGGGSELAAEMAFDDPWAAARLLTDLAEEDASDPVVRAWALEILDAAAAAIGQRSGPTVSPELRDAAAETIHASVADQIRFVHEPKETFQSARVTIESHAGDCDDHARLVYALARVLDIPAELVFFEQQEQPIHVVARLQDSAGVWQWAETTIAADFGEDPHEALARLNLDAGADPLSHMQGIGGPLGFVTAGDVQARKDQVNAQIDSDDADVVNCARLDSGTVSAWNLFVSSWRAFYADEPSFWNAGGQGRQVADYVDQLEKWEAKLKAAGCTVTAAPIPTQSGDATSATIKTVAIAAAVVAGAFAAVEVVRLFPKAAR
jgi:hypothetical protein